jgi:flagellar hook-associated protein 1 FlgK
LEPALGIQTGAGVASALDRFFQAVSALEVSPNDTAARQLALDRAEETAAAFRQTASELDGAKTATSQSIVNQTARLNEIGGKLQELNRQFENDYRAQNDAGLAAEMQTLLEDLAEISDATVLRSENGCVNVYLGGQTPFLMGSRFFGVTADVSGVGARLLDSQGKEFTDLIGGGRMGALLEIRNETIPSYEAELNALAQSVADGVNGVLSGGVDMSGNAPAAGLFVYDGAVGIARSMGTNALLPGELALAALGAPGGNDNARALAALGKEKTTGGFTFTEAYGNLSARVGRDLTGAEQGARIQRELHTQARELRDEVSRVNLDEEAALLLEYQRAYQAAARLFQVLDEMTETVLGLGR